MTRMLLATCGGILCANVHACVSGLADQGCRIEDAAGVLLVCC